MLAEPDAKPDQGYSEENVAAAVEPSEGGGDSTGVGGTTLPATLPVQAGGVLPTFQVELLKQPGRGSRPPHGHNQ